MEDNGILPRTKPSFVFDYLTLRLLVGIIAFTMPFIVSKFFLNEIYSISASYHTGIRDVYVGMLFIVGMFLLVYNGHTTGQAVASKIAGAAAIIAAIFPTSCHSCKEYFTFCDIETASDIHNGAAAVLFLILAYFCLMPFRQRAREKGEKGKRRSIIYIVCGLVMVACIISIGIKITTLPNEEIESSRIIFVREFIALLAFGVAWFVAGRWYRLSLLNDRENSNESISKK